MALPNGRVILDDVDLAIAKGQRVVIQGPSGSGKTTLFRVLAGLWPFGRGVVRVPEDAKILFLPQKPYIPIGTLKEALCYPDKPEAHSDAEVGEALSLCQLGHFADRLDETGNWSMVMSPGEQQRLSFARALLVRPDTTLFRVLAGLWPFGSGQIRIPSMARSLFLPQKPYMPDRHFEGGTCAIPTSRRRHDEAAEVGEVLYLACELGHLADRLDETGNWSMVLSPGEQQRLSFARALLVKPDWLFLDEASSALDEATEAAMYGLLAERLPGLTMVSIAHKPSVVAVP